MVVRVVSVLSLVSMLILVLYLPAAHPPQVFFERIREEHQLIRDFWGADHARAIMARMLAYQEAPPVGVPLMIADAGAKNKVEGAVNNQLGGIAARIANNQYFRSMNMLLALSEYRLSTLMEWMPAMAIFVGVAVLDGCVRRVVKSKEFLQHNPELFALFACLMIAIMCGTVVAMVFPVTLPPMFLPAVMFSIGVCGNLAIANYHRTA